ncbi:MAG: DUF5317 family protein [Chloroflexi bacterium]|nr:DUF5317 family protein [Chloroflexota bacterium]
MPNESSPSARGGNLLGLRYTWAIFTALFVQVFAVGAVDHVSFAAARALLIAAYVALIAALAVDARRPAVLLVLIGATLNFLAIAANGGTMPFDPSIFGVDPATVPHGHGFLTASKDAIVARGDAHLGFLGDTMSLPGRVHLVFSIGDLVAATGLLVMATEVIRGLTATMPSSASNKSPAMVTPTIE